MNPKPDYQAIRAMEIELFGYSDIPEERRGWKISGLGWTGATLETDMGPALIKPGRDLSAEEIEELKARWIAAQHGKVEILDDDE